MLSSEIRKRCAAVRAISLDCYGTLIDWDAGIRQALGELVALRGCDMQRLLVAREELEYSLLAGDYRPYGEVLGESMRQAAAQQGREVDAEATRAFAASMGSWPAFADSAQALGRLSANFKLALLSNVESATLRQSIAPLAVRFTELITAEELRSYKPARAHFEAALERLDLDASQVLHVAGSLYHDIRPALEAGWQVIWINRRGAAIPSDLDPAWVLPDLASLAAALEVPRS